MTEIQQYTAGGAIAQWSEQELAVLRQLGLEEASKGDLDLFWMVCQRTGLDPFQRQIHMIGRKQQTNGGRWTTKYTIQISIDGYRLIGNRAAARAGASVEHEPGAEWCGKDGAWRDVWVDDATPAAARYTMRVNGRAVIGIARFNEFAQFNRGGELTSMWQKMPANQIAKCAEAQAWRKAFPADMSGLSLSDAQHHVLDAADPEPPRKVARPRGLAGIDAAKAERAKRAPEPAVVDAAVVEPEPERPAAPTDDQLRALAALLTEGGATDVGQRRRVMGKLLDRQIGGPGDVTAEEVNDLIGVLSEAQRDGTLAGVVGAVLPAEPDDDAALDAAREAEEAQP